jgi:hypothetical protein
VDGPVVVDDGVHTLMEELGQVGYQPAEEIPPTDSFDMWIYCEREDVMSMDLFPPGRIFGCLPISPGKGPFWTNRFPNSVMTPRWVEASTPSSRSAASAAKNIA